MINPNEINSDRIIADYMFLRMDPLRDACWAVFFQENEKISYVAFRDINAGDFIMTVNSEKIGKLVLLGGFKERKRTNKLPQFVISFIGLCTVAEFVRKHCDDIHFVEGVPPWFVELVKCG